MTKEQSKESACERMKELEKGINAISTDLEIKCKHYKCELKHDKCHYWVVPNEVEYIPEDELQEMRYNANVLTGLLEEKKELEKQYPYLLL